MDPRSPIIVGAAQLNGSEAGNEPIAMMTEVAEFALNDAGALMRRRLHAVRVVKGIWPYRNPGSMVADRLGLEGVSTAMTPIGGNEVYDLLNATAAEIQGGGLDAVLVCGAETMRTRRRDRAAGRRSAYMTESATARPDQLFGIDHEYWDEADRQAATDHAVNFYAMAASAVRHELGLSPEDYLATIASLWASASEIAVANPHASIQTAWPASSIATPSDRNRLVAAPYTKLMTSNIDVDQAAAVIVCSAGTASEAGIPTDRWVFPVAGSGAHDAWTTRARWSLAGSPALRIAGRRALDQAGASIDDMDMLDLYSCFPAAVQVAQRELGIDADRPFTITGGMTFAGGPFNTYCLHAVARAVELLRTKEDVHALLSGNGGFFTKHSFLILGSEPPGTAFGHDRPQATVDAQPTREVLDDPPRRGVIDAYTVTYDRRGGPERAILSVLDDAGRRAWATSQVAGLIDRLVASDAVGTVVDRTVLD